MPNNKVEKAGLETSKHPLLDLEIVPISDWSEWLECWREAKNLQITESLLHVGYTIPLGYSGLDDRTYTRVDREVFYFSIADGWSDPSFFFRAPCDSHREYIVGHDSSGNVIRENCAIIRRRIANKAFSMLCLNFFKGIELRGGGRHHEEFNDHWENLIMSEKFFPILQNFFRIEKGSSSGTITIRNLPQRGQKPHHEEFVFNFLLNLVRFIWGWKDPGVTTWRSKEEQEEEKKKFEPMRLRIDSAKPWLVEILHQMGELNMLREWMLEWDKPTLAKLKEIALRKKFRDPISDGRQVETIEEACYLGSKAGWLIKQHELMKSEQKRLDSISKAQRKREEADRDIAELTKKK